MKSKAECLNLLSHYYHNTAIRYGISRMALFGSVARNEQQDDSDVDIVYEGEANMLLRSRMKRELEEIFKCSVDLVRLRKSLSNSSFEKSINGDLIYV
jgi:predicted nucleotidyltransferase